MESGRLLAAMNVCILLVTATADNNCVRGYAIICTISGRSY